jgi:hypothetical protein
MPFSASRKTKLALNFNLRQRSFKATEDNGKRTWQKLTKPAAGAAFGGFGGALRIVSTEAAELIQLRRRGRTPEEITIKDNVFFLVVEKSNQIPRLSSKTKRKKMSKIPATMRSLVAPKRCTPADYQVVDMPTPTITEPGQVLLRMRAAAINTGDTQFARGASDFLDKSEYEATAQT